MVSNLTDEEFEELDTLYAEKRDHFETFREEYPLLEAVISGKETFYEHAVDVDTKFFEYFRSWSSTTLEGLQIWNKIGVMHRGVTALSNQHIPISHGLMGQVLLGLEPMRDTYWPSFSDTLHQLTLSSKGLDQLIGEVYAHETISENPERFTQVYRNMGKKHRAYMERSLHRMLEYGILDMDGATLTTILHEAEQSC